MHIYCRLAHGGTRFSPSIWHHEKRRRAGGGHQQFRYSSQLRIQQNVPHLRNNVSRVTSSRSTWLIQRTDQTNPRTRPGDKHSKLTHPAGWPARAPTSLRPSYRVTSATFATISTTQKMSKSPASTSSEVAKPSKISVGPIDVLSNPIAQTYTHIHPVVLISTYSLAFGAIVADPVTTLTYGLIPLAGLQAAYLVTCLPVTDGGSAAPPSKEKEKGKGRVKKVKVEATASGRIFVRFPAIGPEIWQWMLTDDRPRFSPSSSLPSSQRQRCSSSSSSSALR
jgi:hypothetical protein